MVVTLRIVLIAAVAIVVSSGTAAAQTPPPDELLLRIDVMQQRITELEHRIRELERALRAAAPPREGGPVLQGWRDVENWRRLRPGMSTRQVRMLLGEPSRVESVAFTSWYYGDNLHGGEVFFNEGRVEGWSEPKP